MSRRKRALEKQRKQNSPARKAKLAKKQQYASYESKEKWREKQERKKQAQLNSRIIQGINKDCPLPEYAKPSRDNCEDCDLKCSSNCR